MKIYTILFVLFCCLFTQCKKAEEKGEAKTSPSTEGASKAAPQNALFVIRPYYFHGTWVFDDEAKGLDKEPFVSGVPEILDALVADIPNAKTGFRLTFSANAFPGHQIEAVRGEASNGGYWYHIKGTGQDGWLCPAMFKYFEEAPKSIFVKADAIVE